MKRLTYLILIISLFIVWGCNKDSSPVTDEQTLDELAIQNAIADIESDEEGDYFYANLDDENENNKTFNAGCYSGCLCVLPCSRIL